MTHGDANGWRRAGDAYEIDWCGSSWSLGTGDHRPGLAPKGRGGRHLALAGLAATGRRDEHAFAPESLVGLEVIHGRLMATFEPRGWHGLTVRAAWGPCRDGRGIDLEVQASATSVGELRRLEVLVETATAADGWPESALCSVFPRDREAAASTYDGRESPAALARLHTDRVAPPGEAREFPSLWFRDEPPAAGSRLCMARSEDVARWSFAKVEAEGGGAVRFALFGFDLEKGVVLRGRLREVWSEANEPTDEVAEERRLFLTEPLPLRTE